MSVAVEHRITCPHCASEFLADLYWSLHVSRRPEIRDALLAGQLQRFDCPDCGRSVLAEPTMLYTDFERHQWYATFSTSQLSHHSALAKLVGDGFNHNMRLACPALVKEWAHDFEVRVVFGLAKLREKVLLAEAGIDDRLIELLLLRTVKELNPAGLTPQTQTWVEAVNPGTLDIFVSIPLRDGRTDIAQRIRVKRQALASIQDNSEALFSSWPALANGPVVDWRILVSPDRPLPPVDPKMQAQLHNRLYGLTKPSDGRSPS